MQRLFYLIVFLFSICYASPPAYEVYFMVENPDLNYKNLACFLHTWGKHPRTKNMDGSIGHAWILLKSPDGNWEVGHSGECCTEMPTYAEAVYMLIKQNDPNPIRPVFSTRNDGYLERGSGGSIPTYAIKVSIDKQQYQMLYEEIFKDKKQYSKYHIGHKQCVTFVQKIASMVGLDLDCRQTIEVPSRLHFAGKEILLWTDPKYAKMEIATTACLELKMKQAVAKGDAENALWEYRQCYQMQKKRKRNKTPARMRRHIKLSRAQSN